MTSTDNTPAQIPAEEGDSALDERWIAVLDSAIAAQAPLARRYVAHLRTAHPEAGRAELLRMISRRFTLLATASGAGIGGAAALPGIGTIAAMGLTVGEGLSFGEAAAFVMLATAEIHEIDMRDRNTRRLVLMAVLSGERGEQIIARAMGRSGHQWGSVLAGGGVVPSLVTKQVSKYVRRRVLSRSGSLWLGRLLPFGIGAVIGGAGARAVSRSVVSALEDIFAQAVTVQGETVEGTAPDEVDARRL